MAGSTTTARIAAVKSELARQGIPDAYIEQIFNDPRIIIYLPPPPATSTATSTIKTPPIDWKKITANLLKKGSRQEGAQFIAKYRGTLRAAETLYGTSKEAITALLKVETNLGLNTGRTRVFNVFATGVANGSDTGWSWYKTNLVALGKYCYQTGKDCLDIKGSSAGAFGLPQFLPYSVLQWGKDATGDGIVDLFRAEDAIVSAANFLYAHGWGKTTASRKKALSAYYGSPVGYADVVLNFGDALKVKKK